MVVIVGGEPRYFGMFDTPLDFQRRHVGKKEVHERKQLPLLLAGLFVADVFPHLGHIDIVAVFDDSVSHGLCLSILDAQHIPVFIFAGSIAYRHPSF